jgi:chromate transporter
VLDLLLQLLGVFGPLSLVAIGGGNSVLPDIHRQVVVLHGWMTDAEFAQAFTLAQTVPGPNILVVSLIGWHVAGLAGAVVAVIAICGPPSVVALVVSRTLANARAAFWRQRLQAGLAPLTIGLMLATGLVIARGADNDLVALGVTITSALVLLRTRIHPLLLIALGATIGVGRAFAGI